MRVEVGSPAVLGDLEVAFENLRDVRGGLTGVFSIPGDGHFEKSSRNRYRAETRIQDIVTLRIIAGKYRGRRLKSPPSQETRPTSDRLRETLFNILAPRIKGARFLDLCAGSGAVGIEALSRGAAHAMFVDQSRPMGALIETNLAALNLDEDDFEVVVAEALEFLRRRVKKGSEPFDIIFFDPPYAADYEVVLDYFGEQAERVLAKDGAIIVEHHKNDLKAEFGGLKRYRVLKQGDSCLSFYEAT